MDALLKITVLTLGGALGVNARYWLGVWISGITGPRFPWATFAINVTGSFAIGFLTVILLHWLPHPNLRLFVITGFLGGYTTFSTFEFDVLNLLERGEFRLSVYYLLGSVGLGFAGVVLGVVLARGLVEPATRTSSEAGQVAAPGESGDVRGS